ncbi:ankyrin repeat and LEM domain-containing protein 2 isoform X2 [Belonocnema kinseyi]|uniref:ankyrin repeat and LEM domain-containing protein 2 isoform X2 n=1 Tax=Belonocnema kinseyi TaxID=2817044 RepID=UPI00143CF599|nr:ankyrin repeat and LEM domain-containing protein 2 isoform X2 [Belonocnema kinseyi]
MSHSVISSFVEYFQEVLRLNSGMNTEKEEPQVQDLCSGEPNLDSNEGLFHAVHIPHENGQGDSKIDLHVFTEKSDALKFIKNEKSGRLKTFKNRLEAENFSRNGGEQPNLDNSKLEITETVPAVGEERASNFKGPKSQDLVRFRKLIEAGDLDGVRSTIWENPRYLVSGGDTPAILQEGSRYNALHVSSKASRSGAMCELILSTIANPKFVQLLYGDVDQQRGEILLDLYLNTPDKGLNETPLHFAVKFGQVDAVRVLVSYSQCVKTLLNKYKQTPLELVCARKHGENEELKREIRGLLEDQFYVPVLRSDDSTLQPVIGEPFSPASPPRLNVDPISPRVEVRAFAGPMTKTQAVEFRRKWKTPPRFQGTSTRLTLTPTRENAHNKSVDSIKFPSSPRSPAMNLSFRLQDTEKGLESVGRDLAEKYHVPWKEFWPFLDGFADLRCADGLWKLEKYLESRFNGTYKPSENMNTPNTLKIVTNGEPLNDLMNLCDKLNSCTLQSNDEEKENIDEVDFYTPPSSPSTAMSCDSSDDEMELADEGATVFIDCNAPTKTDYAVFNAIPPTITSFEYPNIYRWRHEMQIVMKKDSNGSRAPSGIRRKLRL